MNDIVISRGLQIRYLIIFNKQLKNANIKSNSQKAETMIAIAENAELKTRKARSNQQGQRVLELNQKNTSIKD